MMSRKRASDSELLRRWVSEGCEDAFRDLVARHSGMVYSACARWLGDDHLAEDAAQAVFIVLARKAAERAVTIPEDSALRAAARVPRQNAVG